MTDGGPARAEYGDRLGKVIDTIDDELQYEVTYTGLYAIIWEFRTGGESEPYEEDVPAARKVLTKLLETPGRVLRRAIWTQDPFGPALDPADLQDEWFADPDEATGEYIVIDQASERPSQSKPWTRPDNR